MKLNGAGHVGVILAVVGGALFIGEKFIPQLKAFGAFAKLGVVAGGILVVVGWLLK